MADIVWDLSWDYGVLEETLWGDGTVCILTVVIKYTCVMGNLVSQSSLRGGS